MATKEKRGFWWWLTAILAPFGIIGGPFAIAGMLSGVVKWNGWVGYLVNLWNDQFAEPLQQALGYVFAWINLPTPPLWLANYLAIGVLLYSQYMRSFFLFPMDIEPKIEGDGWKFSRSPETPPTHPRWYSMRAIGSRLKWILNYVAVALMHVIAALLAVVLWPVFAYFILRMFRIFRNFRKDNSYFGRGIKKHAAQTLLLVLSPFVIFSALWVTNFFAPSL